MLKKQDSSTTPYQVTTKITLDRLCNSLAVKNAGNSICVLNDDPLQPGETKIFTAWPNELVIGRYNFYFQTPPVVPIGYVQMDLAIVSQQFYLPEPK